MNNKYANFAIILEARKHFTQELLNKLTGAISWDGSFDWPKRSHLKEPSLLMMHQPVRARAKRKARKTKRTMIVAHWAAHYGFYYNVMLDGCYVVDC